VPTHADALAAIERYERTYRSSSLAALRRSEVYDLFPDNGQYGWPEPWPFTDDAGVYIVMDSALEVLYVGTSARLGWRLSEYFVYQNRTTGPCKVKDSDWVRPPRYVFCIAVPEQFKCEAPALECFLIQELNPPNNRRGLKPGVLLST